MGIIIEKFDKIALKFAKEKIKKIQNVWKNA